MKQLPSESDRQRISEALGRAGVDGVLYREEPTGTHSLKDERKTGFSPVAVGNVPLSDFLCSTYVRVDDVGGQHWYVVDWFHTVAPGRPRFVDVPNEAEARSTVYELLAAQFMKRVPSDAERIGIAEALDRASVDDVVYREEPIVPHSLKDERKTGYVPEAVGGVPLSDFLCSRYARLDDVRGQHWYVVDWTRPAPPERDRTIDASSETEARTTVFFLLRSQFRIEP